MDSATRKSLEALVASARKGQAVLHCASAKTILAENGLAWPAVIKPEFHGLQNSLGAVRLVTVSCACSFSCMHTSHNPSCTNITHPHSSLPHAHVHGFVTAAAARRFGSFSCKTPQPYRFVAAHYKNRAKSQVVAQDFGFELQSS
jgi:hypothetical protein